MMTLLTMLANSVSEVLELEILKVNAVAMVVSGDLCNLLVFRLEATSLAVNFSYLLLGIFFSLSVSLRQNLVCPFI